MASTADRALYRRFLNTVRVATATALAEYELTAGRASAAAPVVFRALAAKGPADWRFPESGLAAGDGLLRATLQRGADGRPLSLTLQAEGATGLDSYAGRTATVQFGPFGPEAAASFDGKGTATVDLEPLGLDEADLADFGLALAGGEA